MLLCLYAALCCWVTGLLAQHITELTAYAKEYKEHRNLIYASNGLKRPAAISKSAIAFMVH